MKTFAAICNSKRHALLLLFLMLSIAGKAQISNKKLDSLITNKTNWYGIKTQEPTLFIHFDKTVYVGYENIWFTGYFLNLINPSAYKTLSIALVKDDSRAVVMENKFVIANGLTFGNMLMPDTIPAGNYSFIAYTNHLLNGAPEVLFTQPISKKNNDELAFTASFNPLDTSATKSQQKIMLLVNFIDRVKPPFTVPINYYVGNSAHPVLKGSVNTKMGQYIFTIPSKLLSLGANKLHAQIIFGSEIKEISIDLPSPLNAASVKFYPEGGNLVNNVKNTIGWEVKQLDNSPVSTKAILYQDKNVIDTIKTNNYGLGRFTLTPKAGSEYYVRISNINKKDTVYKLPVALSNIPQITIPFAVANNILIVSTHSEQRQKLYFIVHNYKQVFADTTIEMAVPNRRVSILLNDIPKGLTQLTVTDSLGRPFAERLFFAHYNQRPDLKITTDQSNYKTRQKVSLKIKLNGTAFPDSGMVSIACVQQSRFELNKQNDIESYFYLKHNLGDLPLKQNYFGYAAADKQYLEDILLIKGWKRYTWTDLLKTTPADTVLKFKDLAFNGKILRYGDKIKQPVNIINFNHPLHQVTTDNAGDFVVNDDDMIIPPTRKVRFMVDNDARQTYHISVSDPYLEINKKLARDIEFNDFYTPQQNTGLAQIKGLEHDRQLKEVKIIGKKDYKFSFAHRNSCGDYVCRNHILNCPNHPYEDDNTVPVIGQFYTLPRIRGDPVIVIAYQGCDPLHVVQVDGVYQAQEYSPSDYSKETTGIPDYVSTIYWNYLAKVNSANEAEFSFYTSDLVGTFKIIVQGRTGNDMIYGEQTIEVR